MPSPSRTTRLLGLGVLTVLGVAALFWARPFQSGKEAENEATFAQSPESPFGSPSGGVAVPSESGGRGLRGEGEPLAAPSGGPGREVFVRAGWSEVQVDRPDPEVLELRPAQGGSDATRRERERAVTLQLQSAVLGDEQIPAAGRWVRDGEAGERVREAALEALGRSRSERAQDELVRLWNGSPDLPTATRRRVLELLHAGRRLEDPQTQALLRLLQDDRASEADRDQAAYSLALGAALSADLEQQLTRALGEGAARARFVKMLKKVSASVGPES